MNLDQRIDDQTPCEGNNRTTRTKKVEQWKSFFYDEFQWVSNMNEDPINKEWVWTNELTTEHRVKATTGRLGPRRLKNQFEKSKRWEVTTCERRRCCLPWAMVTLSKRDLNHCDLNHLILAFSSSNETSRVFLNNWKITLF